MKNHAPATMRNRKPILEVLNTLMPHAAKILEIASGTGEHAAYFCQKRPDISWQASDMAPEAIASIAEWKHEFSLTNLQDPLLLDVTQEWCADRFDGISCINMTHISPWEATIALFEHAPSHLNEGGFLYIYGPYLEDEVATAGSNLQFDQSLRQRNPAWGLRRKEDLLFLADKNGLVFKERIAMPAENISLVFKKA